MASTIFSLEDAKKSILEEGFFDLNDPAIGEHILKMAEKGFPFFTEYGLDFCKDHVLDDKVSRTRYFYHNYLTVYSVLSLSSNPSLKGVLSDTG
jgi:hypothetical protein